MLDEAGGAEREKPDEFLALKSEIRLAKSQPLVLSGLVLPEEIAYFVNPAIERARSVA